MFDAIVKRYGSPRDHWAGGLQIRKEWRLWGRRIILSMRDSQGMGRFGGGWDWKLGVQWGGSTVIWSLLVLEISIRPITEEK